MHERGTWLFRKEVCAKPKSTSLPETLSSETIKRNHYTMRMVDSLAVFSVRVDASCSSIIFAGMLAFFCCVRQILEAGGGACFAFILGERSLPSQRTVCRVCFELFEIKRIYHTSDFARQRKKGYSATPVEKPTSCELRMLRLRGRENTVSHSLALLVFDKPTAGGRASSILPSHKCAICTYVSSFTSRMLLRSFESPPSM